ncbi:hypothetical protein FISHEDRAFT_76783 [Fistulina hepatica ATCC 64428]|uniref:Uncharacterized protein n=1 Tax=Fistulina hepatica ATCC 64428 TaxID=1128425 RepID=A0A0D7A3G3_9AGAR|nr:hypothetical protein FISHEDRAFT_76783 [Fistulina hepatica ATCC 64428]
MPDAHASQEDAAKAHTCLCWRTSRMPFLKQRRDDVTRRRVGIVTTIAVTLTSFDPESRYCLLFNRYDGRNSGSS